MQKQHKDFKELRKLWALKHLKEDEYEQEIDKIQINDYEIEAYDKKPIMNMKESDSDLKVLRSKEISSFGEISEENKGKNIIFDFFIDDTNQSKTK